MTELSFNQKQAISEALTTVINSTPRGIPIPDVVELGDLTLSLNPELKQYVEKYDCEYELRKEIERVITARKLWGEIRKARSEDYIPAQIDVSIATKTARLHCKKWKKRATKAARKTPVKKMCV